MPTATSHLKLSRTLLHILLFTTHPARAQFEQWLSYYSKAYRFKWGDKCDTQLSQPKDGHSWCEDISDCILQNTPETQKANMAGAGVLMGLVPTVLGTIAPSLEEMALLFDHRPFLTFLISAGSPGIHITRLFSDTDPELPLYEFGESHAWNLWVPRTRVTAILVSIFEYLLAIASISNVTHISLDLAYKSIVSWSCPNKWWVLGWGIAPTAIYTVAAVVFKFTSPRVTRKHIEAKNWVQWLWRYEFSPCSRRVRPSYKVNKLAKSQIARYIAPTLSYAHLVIGTAVLSSLLYVPFRDGIPIILRWILSGLFARIVVAYELACLAQNHKEDGVDSEFVPYDDSDNDEVSIAPK